jgi:hypothetical protein
MKLPGILLASAALCGALVISDPAEAYRGFRGGGWHRAGWGGAGLRGAGWRGARWGGAGWRGARWGGAGWRGARWGWAGNRWGWNRGWGWGGWGWPAAAGVGVAATSPWWGSNYSYYGYPYSSYGYNYPYSSYGYNYPYYGSGLAAAATAPVAAATTAPFTFAAATTAPVMTGRSVATGPVQMGNYCTTPAKTCQLIQQSWVGNGCSCRIPGGRAHGSVTQ